MIIGLIIEKSQRLLNMLQKILTPFPNPPMMTEDEIADMFLQECLYNAGIIDESPFDDEIPEDPS